MTEGDHDDESVELVDPYLGTVLADRYRVVRKIGSGGMGSVYEAVHADLGKRVAVKILHPQFASDASVVRRFRNEGKAAGRLQHGNIVECTDFGRTRDGAPFLVMEFLEGRTVADDLAANGAMPIGRATRIAAQVCAALGAAHREGIVHRDVKPENVFLVDRRDGADHVKVVDFGISKFDGQMTAATRTGQVLGSPYYMAPEQVQDASKSDARTDVYAVGAVLYQMLTGRVPFVAKSFPMLVVKITTEMPPPVGVFRSDVPAELTEVVARAMAKRREDRIPDMHSFGDALAPYFGMNEAPRLIDDVGDQAVSAPAITTTPFATTNTIPGERTGPSLAGWILGGVGLVALLVAVGIGYSSSGSDDTSSTTSTSAPPAGGDIGGTPARSDDEIAPSATAIPAPPSGETAIPDAGHAETERVAERRTPGPTRMARVAAGETSPADPVVDDPSEPEVSPPPSSMMSPVSSTTMQVGGVPINSDPGF
jgi:serine/threonine-protein kinase